MITDSEIVMQLVDELMKARLTAPYIFRIAYDAKIEPARVRIHRVVKNGRAGEVTMLVTRSARQWCEDALREGYEVERVLGRGFTVSASVERRRSQLEWKEKRAAMTPAQLKAEDDSIPF